MEREAGQICGKDIKCPFQAIAMIEITLIFPIKLRIVFKIILALLFSLLVVSETIYFCIFNIRMIADILKAITQSSPKEDRLTSSLLA